MDLSVVIPLRDEAESIPSLLVEIGRALDGVVDYEVICVDDGSRDASPATIRSLAATSPRLRLIRHLCNAGQSAALLSGVRAARASWVVTLDGDGQNVPADIFKLWTALQTAEDPRMRLVTGVRRHRADSVAKRIASQVANAVRRRALKDGAVDSACGLKLFRRATFLSLPYFDHIHRFLPALVQRAGGGVLSVPVEHRRRLHGRSHYGIGDRLWVGIVDLLGVMWLCRRFRLPEVTEDTLDPEAADAFCDSMDHARPGGPGAVLDAFPSAVDSERA